MYKSKKKRNIIIVSLVGVLLCMVVGYATFNTELKISGTSKVTSNWDIEITNVTPGTPTGSAENTVAPTWDALTASMEADLYEKGDAMEYDVTIENKGTIDAKLNDVLTNIENANSEAVNITFSGYTKGEILKSKAVKVIHVKIEYNPNYDGGETSSEVEVNFDYEQNNNKQNNPDSQYLLTFDYQTNGGIEVDIEEEYYGSGNEINLTNQAYKEGYTFIGWNIDKDAKEALTEYEMPENSVTLYAIYSKTLKVTYEKGNNVESISKNEDTCNLYNNETYCEIILPDITGASESTNVNWYHEKINIGKPNDKYKISRNITLVAKASGKPVIKSWNFDVKEDFHTEEYYEKIITANFLSNRNIPENAVAIWDISEKQDESVMAWVITDEQDSTKYHLYIGGEGGVIANENSSFFFANFPYLKTINFNDNFDTSNVINMSYMFYYCQSLEDLDINNWDTSNVKDMSSMFLYCTSLGELNLNNWNTGNVTNMNSMFAHTHDEFNTAGLTKLEINNWDTSKVEDMSYMFFWSEINTLDLSNWDTSNVKNMDSMFSICDSLTELNISNFNTSNVTNMYEMFSNCNNLIVLKLCSFNTSKVTNMDGMFFATTKLTAIYVGPNWTTENATADDIFLDSGVSEVNQSDKCIFEAAGIDFNTSTTSTINSISVVASSRDYGKITKYEFSINNGEYIDNGNNNIYTFTNLKSNTDYNIKVRITTTSEDILTTDTIIVKTKLLETPTFTDENYLYDSEIPVEYNASSTGEYAWSETNGVWKSGNYHEHSTTSSITFAFTLDNTQTISFDWSVSCQDNFGIISTDYLYYTIYKDGSTLTGTGEDTKIFGTGRGSDENTLSYEHVTHTLESGNYQVTFTYKKDVGPVSSGLDAGYVKNFYAGSIPVKAMGKTVTITYPEGENLTYEYQINNGEWIKANRIQEIDCKESGTIIARVTDGINTASSSYTIEVGIPPIIDNISTVSTTNSITVVASAHDQLGSIVKYEYSINDGDYIEGSNSYTFTGLTSGKEYNIKVKITNDSGMWVENKLVVGTNTIELPVFSETGTGPKTVTITYPDGCGSTLTCTYQKNNEEVINVTSKTVDVKFTENGNLVATVTDGTNVISNSYNVKLFIDITDSVVTSGDGLYEDSYEEGRYIYRGQNPDNYIEFNDELWRIIAKETDGTYKIIRNDILEKRVFDEANHRSTEKNTYCDYPVNGCGVYAAVDGEFSSLSGNQKGTVTEDSSIKIYLNDDYYVNNINETAKGQMTSHTFNIGAVENLNQSGAETDSIEKNIAGEKMYQWTGNVGLANVSDILRASTNPLCTSATTSSNGTNECNSNYLLDSGTANTLLYWTINANSYESFDGPYSIWGAAGYKGSNMGVYTTMSTGTIVSPRPVVFLKSDITLNGSGTSEDPFIIV